ncbi:hypothetical protein RN001_013559 [Aquatica leii]|uniref:UBC core domain-containing protein n=1 Tax=Aquatica leii TaxID=1421715 RepID=A0AAN7SDZ3_9COLE|nr:hypothetical protein RN001_013559 [Aquatica leii]
MSVVNEIKEFYTNDVVYRFDKHKKINFGVVVDSYEASTDSDECNILQKGQIRVWWLNSARETVWKQNKVRLMSRCIIPGDIVRRLENGKETQRGYCKEGKQYATVQIVGTDKIIERVTSERLSVVAPFDTHVAVCLGTKYGRIQFVDQKITMRSKCGSTVEIFSSINHDVEDYWLSKSNRNYFESFYPGQEVRCTPNNLEQPQWLHRSKAMKRSMQTRQRFTVQKAEPIDIEVCWYDSMESASPTEIKTEDVKNLKVVEPIENSHLELAERRLLKLNPSDILIKKRDWIRKKSALHQPEHHKVLHIVNRTSRKDRGPKIRRPSLLSTCVNITEPEEGWWTEECEEEISDNGSSSSTTSITRYHTKHFPPKLSELVPGHTVAVEVICMDSKVTIVWQDGTEEKDIPTTQLYYSISLDDHEFFPGEWVVQEGKNEKQYGAIQHVNHLERTATVKWFTYSEGNEKPQLTSTNEMSVYDLKKHTKYAFRPGSIVKRSPVETEKLGIVLDSCPEGYVIVQWVSGLQENCWPHNLELIPETIDYEYSIADNDDSAQVSWETESIESIAGDLTDESTLQNMAARLDFVRGRVTYLKDVLKQHNSSECFLLLKELLMIYDNSSYLDKLLDTSFFSLKSRHFQVLLAQIKEKAKTYGVELRGRLFSTVENLGSSLTRTKNPEKENISKVLKLEHKLATHLGEDGKEVAKELGEPSTPLSPECEYESSPNENICVELLSMMKVRMDLAYAEIISRIGGPQALTVMTKASDALPRTSTPLPSMPTTPEDKFCTINPLKLNKSVIACENEVYCLLDEVHFSHRFYSSKFEPTDRQTFYKAVQKEFKLLKESLPPGVWVRSYANRMDLLSVMIEGPKKTPYEDGLFLFDLQLSQDYPRSPPLCHYISYSSERLNPNLYVEGKVCISLLGTWLGKGTEIWGTNSTLLQLIVSIQGLILVAEPYYNEAGYEKQVESQQGYENSRTYNELVILKLVQSMTELAIVPPEVFKKEIYAYCATHGDKLCERLNRWCDDSDPLKPEFPLLPVSKGLKLSLKTALQSFKEVLKNTVKKHISSSDAQSEVS